MGRKGDQALLLLSQDKGSPNIQLQSVPSVASLLCLICKSEQLKDLVLCVCVFSFWFRGVGFVLLQTRSHVAWTSLKLAM